MKLFLALVTPKRPRSSEETERLVADYIERLSRYVSCEPLFFRSEDDLLGSLNLESGRTPTYAVLLDSRGKQLSSEEFATYLGRLRDNGTQRVLLAIGPADGWSGTARERADLLLSFGRITLPHQLARVVLAEQVYRAFTILSGHPYHSGH